MKQISFEKIVDFLIGVSWAFIALGAFFVFRIFFIFDFPTALFSAFVFIVFSLLILLMLDSFIVHRKRLEEARKQTQILEQIVAKLDERSVD